MNRAYLNLGLLVLVAGLGAAVYFTQKKEEKGAPLTALAADAVRSITLAHPGQPTIRLEKQGSGWQLLEPVQAPADPFEVATLANLATQETRRTLPVAEVQPAELKLEPPQFTVTLNDEKLDFGDVEPLEFRRYVRHGDTVALIDDPSATSVDADYSNLLAKELLPAGAEIEKIEVPGLAVARGADGKSWAATPASSNSDAVARFVESWRKARAMWNAAMPADGGKGEPITLTLKDGVVRYVLVSRDPQLMIDRPDLKVRYTLSKADAVSLLELTVPPPARDEAKPAVTPPAPVTPQTPPATKP